MNEAELHRAIAAHRAGEGVAAERHYRSFLAVQPQHAGAHHNLGLLMVQRGAPDEALEHFALACRGEPARAQNWFSYAKAMLAAGRPAEALPLLQEAGSRGLGGQAFEAALQQAQTAAAQTDPAGGGSDGATGASKEAESHFQHGNMCVGQGKADDAIAAYRRALALEPDFAEAHFRLGSLLSEAGAIAEGFLHYLRRAQLVHGNSAVASSGKPEAPHKVKHDREQRDYLKETGVAPAGFHLMDGGRIPAPAVNPRKDMAALLEQWRTGAPQLVVIDDFLSQPALEKLRLYCAGSTIWHRVYEAGYIGATPEDGLACPLMAQIAEEIQSRFAGILGPHRFRYLGAFKYDSSLSTGTNIHADNAAVNVNFYITPDEANLDPESGGLDVWDVAPASEAQMRRLNGDEAMVRAFIAGAELTRIPHRANRATIFRSDLVHKTSACRFAEGYLNKRINVSLLFGDRERTG